MPLNFDFGSPGGAATDALQAAMLQQDQLKRQAMLDELNKRNIESEIATREQQRKTAEENAVSLRLQREAAASKAAEEAKAKGQDEANKVLMGTPIGTPSTPQLRATAATAGHPEAIQGAGQTLGSVQTMGVMAPNMLPQSSVVKGQDIQGQNPEEPALPPDPIANASNRKEAVRAAITAGVPFHLIDSLVSQKFGKTKTNTLLDEAPTVTTPSPGVQTEGVYAGLPVQVAAKLEQENFEKMDRAVSGAKSRDEAIEKSAGLVHNKADADARDRLIDTKFKAKEAEEAARIRASQKANNTNIDLGKLLTPETVSGMARFERSGGNALSGLGSMGTAGLQLKAKILNEAFGKEPDLNLGEKQSLYKATSSALTKQVESVASLTRFTKTASDNLDLVQAASSKVARTDSQFVNGIVQNLTRRVFAGTAGSGNSLSPEETAGAQLSDFETKIYTAIREYAKAAQATGTVSGAALTDSATQEAQRLLNAAQTPEQLKAAISAMKADMANMVKEGNSMVGALRNDLKTMGDQPAPNVVTPPASERPRYNPATGKVETPKSSKNPTYNPATGKVE